MINDYNNYNIFFKEFGESFFPEYVYEALRKYSSSNSLKGRQEDAEEYLGFLLNGIHDEFVSSKNYKFVFTNIIIIFIIIILIIFLLFLLFLLYLFLFFVFILI